MKTPSTSHDLLLGVTLRETTTFGLTVLPRLSCSSTLSFPSQPAPNNHYEEETFQQPSCKAQASLGCLLWSFLMVEFQMMMWPWEALCFARRVSMALEMHPEDFGRVFMTLWFNVAWRRSALRLRHTFYLENLVMFVAFWGHMWMTCFGVVEKKWIRSCRKFRSTTTSAQQPVKSSSSVAVSSSSRRMDFTWPAQVSWIEPRLSMCIPHEKDNVQKLQLPKRWANFVQWSEAWVGWQGYVDLTFRSRSISCSPSNRMQEWKTWLWPTNCSAMPSRRRSVASTMPLERWTLTRRWFYASMTLALELAWRQQERRLWVVIARNLEESWHWLIPTLSSQELVGSICFNGLQVWSSVFAVARFSRKLCPFNLEQKKQSTWDNYFMLSRTWPSIRSQLTIWCPEWITYVSFGTRTVDHLVIICSGPEVRMSMTNVLPLTSPAFDKIYGVANISWWAIQSMKINCQVREQSTVSGWTQPPC